MRIGAHVPVAGGLQTSVAYAVDTGCETIQVFSRSPRRWSTSPRSLSETAAFVVAAREAGIGPVFTHASYLINLGATDPLQWELSCTALAEEYRHASAIEAAGVVIHLGRRFSDDDAECVARIVETVAEGFARAEASTATLLLENSAGAGRQFGADIDELCAAFAALTRAGIPTGLCIDTCHAHAAGSDVRTAEGWSAIMDRIEGTCGAGAVALVHANDCKGACGTHTDRHEWIGDGMIGEEGFRAMFAEPRLADASVVVEMPGEAPTKDEENVRRLRRLRDVAGGSASPDPERA